MTRINVNEQVPLTIDSKEEYSTSRIQVQQGEQYEFTCDKEQRWKDAFIKCSPNGFFNILSWLAGQRVKRVKCFCLCGAYNGKDKDAFAIGSRKIIAMVHSGDLSFFANDTTGHYKNNSGSVELEVKRLK